MTAPLDPEHLLEWLCESSPSGDRSVAIIAIDGRSGSGKTTLARTLAGLRDDIAVIASDDVAWHHSFFGWDAVARTQLLEPLRKSGPPLAFRPDPWIEHHRPGFIRIPEGTSVVLFEGVGTGREALFDLVDHVVWIEMDETNARRRLHARGGTDGQPENPDFVDAWLAEEETFLDRDRPWTRASVLVSN